MYKGIIFAILASLCWSISPIFYRRLLCSLSYLELNFLRCFGFVASVLPFALSEGSPWDFLRSADLREVFVLSFHLLVGLGLGDMFYFVAIRHVGVSKAVSIGSSYVLFSAALGVFFLREPFGLEIAVGTGSVLGGIFLVKGADLGNALEGGEPGKGYLAAISSALCWGLAIFAAKFLLVSSGHGPAVLTLWKAISLTLFSGLLLFARRGLGVLSLLASLSPLQWLEVLVGGALGLGLGGLLSWWALDLAPSTLVVPFTALSPVFSALLAAACVRERLSPRLLSGVALIVLGAVVISY